MKRSAGGAERFTEEAGLAPFRPTQRPAKREDNRRGINAYCLSSQGV
jgi:hypothetical protein